jgi:hypothetical protein
MRGLTLATRAIWRHTANHRISEALSNHRALSCINYLDCARYNNDLLPPRCVVKGVSASAFRGVRVLADIPPINGKSYHPVSILHETSHAYTCLEKDQSLIYQSLEPYIWYFSSFVWKIGLPLLLLRLFFQNPDFSITSTNDRPKYHSFTGTIRLSRTTG